MTAQCLSCVWAASANFQERSTRGVVLIWQNTAVKVRTAPRKQVQLTFAFSGRRWPPEALQTLPEQMFLLTRKLLFPDELLTSLSQ